MEGGTAQASVRQAAAAEGGHRVLKMSGEAQGLRFKSKGQAHELGEVDHGHRRLAGITLVDVQVALAQRAGRHYDIRAHVSGVVENPARQLDNKLGLRQVKRGPTALGLV